MKHEGGGIDVVQVPEKEYHSLVSTRPMQAQRLPERMHEQEQAQEVTASRPDAQYPILGEELERTCTPQCSRRR